MDLMNLLVAWLYPDGRRLIHRFLALTLLLLAANVSKAGVTVHLELDYNAEGANAYYLLFPSLTTNSLTAFPANTGYFVWSSSSTSNSAAFGQLLPDGTNPYSGQGYGDYSSLIHDVTNLWTLVVTNTTSTNLYHFRFSNFASNTFPRAMVAFPTDLAVGVTNKPTYIFNGPTNYDQLSVQVADNGGGSFYESTTLPLTQTNWSGTALLTYGNDYSFFASYNRDASGSVVSTAPTNGLGQAYPGWSSAVSEDTYATSLFTVTNPFAGGPIPLGFALNATNFTWTTNGDAGWSGELPISHDGIAAAQSGILLDNQTAVVQTTVTGPATLSFWWQTTGESDNFALECDLDGSFQSQIGSQAGWTQGNIIIPSGSHLVSWTAFSNDGSATDDAAFLDEVVFTPYTPPATGNWTATGAMSNAIYLQTSTLLPNGKVLSLGGSDNSGNAFTSAQLYDPSTGIWKATNAMSKARYAHTATLLPNGKILVVGGITNYSPSGLVQTVELYNPTNSTWTTTGSLKFPRYGHTATLLANGKVLVVGGTGTNGSNVNLTNIYPSEVYDPSTGSWSTNGALIVGRFGHTATLLPNGKVLVAGGETTNYFIVTGESELFDPATGNWAQTSYIPYPIGNHTATLLPSGKVLIAAGDIDFGSFGGVSLVPVNYSAVYDPASESWSQSGNLNKGHDFHTATLLTNGLVLVAGFSTYNSTNTSAELYDPAVGIWTTAAPMKFPRNQHTATLLPSGKVLVTGGLMATSELYDSANPAVIQITGPVRLPNGTFQFFWTNTPGSSNTIVASTNAAILLQTWQAIGAGTETSSGHFQFTDSSANTNSRRFYRVRSP